MPTIQVEVPDGLTVEEAQRAVHDVLHERVSYKALRSALVRNPVAPASAAAAAHVEQRWRDIDVRWGLFDSAEVARRSGSRAGNPRTYAAGLRKQGRLLGVERAGRIVHPGFQFDDRGRPLPVIADLLATFRAAKRDESAVVFWLTNEAHWIPSGAEPKVTPADLLVTDPDAVRAAAAEHVDSHVW